MRLHECRFRACANTASANHIQASVSQPEHKLDNLPVSSSTPPTFPAEKEQLFRDVLQEMNESGIPYAVSGTFALAQHTGIWRDTKDLDLFLPVEDVGKALDYLQRRGYEIYVKDPTWLAKAKRNGYFVDLITGMSNGVLRVDRSWIDRSVDSQVLGIPVRVLNAEELIASKLFVAFRERFDGADVVHLIYASRNNPLDWPRLIQLMGDHWELLMWSMVFFHYLYPAHSNIVPRDIWTTMIRRLEESLDHVDVRAPFRGSLIDENMFAIDVKEWGLENVVERYRNRPRQIIEHPGGEPEEEKVAS